MNKKTKLIITILIGWLGIHKFFEKKNIEGFIYMFTIGLFMFGWIIDIVNQIQEIKNIPSKKINNTQKYMGLIFGLLLFATAFSNIGTKDFNIGDFLLYIFCGGCLLKFHFWAKPKNYIYSSNQMAMANNNYCTNCGLKLNSKNKYCTNCGNPINSLNKLEAKQKNKNNELSKNQHISNKFSFIKEGEFYDKNLNTKEKYKNIETPKYILLEIKEQLYPSGNIRIETENTDFIKQSLKYKNSYVENADFYPFNTYYPKFNYLNKYQFKWYLYWRKEFLNGNSIDTDISYIFLFAYELINYTFNDSAAFNISVMESLYENYKGYYPKLANYLPEWKKELLAETGYFNNNYAEEIEEDTLVNALTQGLELDKLSINIWKRHFNERNTELNNKQLSLVTGNQKFYNRIKKYAGALAKWYIDNDINIVEKWFYINEEVEKKDLFFGGASSLQRRQGTFKTKRYEESPDFIQDLNEITKLSFDCIFPNSNLSENEMINMNFKNGKYELPDDFIENQFKIKKKNEFMIDSSDIKTESINLINKNTKLEINNINNDFIENQLKIEKKKEFMIDLSNIKTESINLINENTKLEIDNIDKDFIRLFNNNTLSKKIAKQYCLKKGKMLNAYINELNNKYYSKINKELLLIDEEIIRLNEDCEV